MGQERLNNLALMSMEREQLEAINWEEIVKILQRLKQWQIQGGPDVVVDLWLGLLALVLVKTKAVIFCN